MLTWARLLNGGINIFGWAISSLGLFLVILQSLNVFNRYFFAQNKYFGLFTTFYDEVLLVAFSALFMLGSAFAFNRDAHVRVDILYAGLSKRGQAMTNLFGTLIFMIPLAAVIYYYSLSNIEQAWKLAESGPNGDDGVTFFWLWKTFVPAFCALTILGGLNHMIQNFARVTRNVRLTNIVFGLAFIGIGAVGAMAAFGLSPVGVFDENGYAANWVAYAETRKPSPEYRLHLWTMIVWGARLGSMLMAVIGAWAVVRALLGLIDSQASDHMLAKLDEEENAPMGDA